MIIWHVLTTGKAYTDLGPDYYTTRSDPAKETQRLIAKLEALGHKVTLAPAAEPPRQLAPPGAAAPLVGPVSY